MFPPVLGMSIESVTFYEEFVGLDATKTMAAKCPNMLSYSLENRLKARLAQCQEAGIPFDAATLLRMGQYTEDMWSNSLAFQKRKLLKQ